MNEHFVVQKALPASAFFISLTVEFFVYVTKSFVGDVRVNLGG